jgi:hypothetical protein
MKRAKPRHCLNCDAAFVADPRNAHHQQYCLAPACRKASKNASQERWLAKPENLNYHSGPVAVARVQAWQVANPEFRGRQKSRRRSALQDLCPAQVIDLKQESGPVAETTKSAAAPALQDFINAQPLVFVGLISHFFNITLQDDIANTARLLQELGEDIANGRGASGTVKTDHLPRALAPGAGAI